MGMTSMVISVILTIVILLLSLLTISKGYGFKHKVDPLEEDKEQVNNMQKTNNN